MKKHISTSFSFIVFACLLTISNGALAMDIKAFGAKYGYINGYSTLTTPGVTKALNEVGIEVGTYVFKPTRDEKTNLFVPAIIYKSGTGQIETIKLDPALAVEQVENEIAKFKSTKVIAQTLAEKSQQLHSEKIKNDIMELENDWRSEKPGSYARRMTGVELDHSDPEQVARIVNLGERANKALGANTDLLWATRLQPALNAAIVKYKNNPSDSTYGELAHEMATIFSNLGNYYHIEYYSSK